MAHEIIHDILIFFIYLFIVLVLAIALAGFLIAMHLISEYFNK